MAVSRGVIVSLGSTIDEKSQRAVWKAADGTSTNIVMGTGIDNLTEDQADVLLPVGPEQIQTGFRVRLDETEQPESQGTTAKP